MNQAMKFTLVAAAILLVACGVPSEARKLNDVSNTLRYRLVSLTQWGKPGANISALNTLEGGVIANCSKYYTWGVIGYSSNKSATPDWASHIKVLDFLYPENYTAYATCVASQPGRVTTTAYETAKDRVLFKSPLDGSEAGITNNSYWHASAVNVTDRAATLVKRKTIFNDVSSLLQFAEVGEDIGLVAKSADTATVVSFNQLQGATAYSFYKKGYGNTPALPVYTQLVALQTFPSRTIEFVPVQVKP